MKDKISIIIFIVLALLWGSAALLIKKGLIYFSPYEVGAMRIFFGTITLLPLTFYHFNKIDKKDWKYIIIAGFIGSLIPALLYAYAQQRIDSSTAGVLSSITPLFTVLISIVVFKEKYKTINYIGMFLGFLSTCGLILYKSNGTFAIGYYALFILLAASMYAINLNLFKYKLGHVPPLRIAGGVLIGAGLAALGILLYHNTFTKVLTDPMATIPFLYMVGLGIFVTGGTLILFNILLKNTTPMFAGSVTYLIPFVASVLGILDGEIVTIIMWLLTGCILVSLYLISKK